MNRQETIPFHFGDLSQTEPLSSTTLALSALMRVAEDAAGYERRSYVKIPIDKYFPEIIEWGCVVDDSKREPLQCAVEEGLLVVVDGFVKVTPAGWALYRQNIDHKSSEPENVADSPLIPRERLAADLFTANAESAAISPALPYKCTPRRVASNELSPCPTKAPVTPASTSPDWRVSGLPERLAKLAKFIERQPGRTAEKSEVYNEIGAYPSDIFKDMKNPSDKLWIERWIEHPRGKKGRVIRLREIPAK